MTIRIVLEGGYHDGREIDWTDALPTALTLPIVNAPSFADFAGGESVTPGTTFDQLIYRYALPRRLSRAGRLVYVLAS